MTEQSLAHTIVPKSDQANADDLIASPVTVEIQAVTQGDKDSPVWIVTSGFEGRPWKPCKSMRRVLISAWGEYGSKWVGKSVTLFCDPEVVYGGVKVGGIRISHMSHIDADLALSLTATRGKRKPFTVKRMPAPVAPAKPAPATPYPAEQFAAQLDKMRGSIASGKSTADKIVEYCLTIGTLTLEQVAAICAPAAEPVTTEEDVF
jgi:hypothetical protein